MRVGEKERGEFVTLLSSSFPASELFLWLKLVPSTYFPLHRPLLILALALATSSLLFDSEKAGLCLSLSFISGCLNIPYVID